MYQILQENNSVMKVSLIIPGKYSTDACILSGCIFGNINEPCLLKANKFTYMYKFVESVIDAHCSYSITVSFLFAITAAGAVPCGGPKKSLHASSIVQIIFSFWSFEIRDRILRNQNIIIGLDSFSNQSLLYLAPFEL